MENNSGDCPTSIEQLSDDCLLRILNRLDSLQDRESFGLTCQKWLQIQSSSRQSLQCECSFTMLSISSLSQATEFNTLHLTRLLNRFMYLRSLSLSGCIELTDAGLSPLQHYGFTLESLYLDCCFNITNTGLSYITSGCPSLMIISLYRCNITDVGLQKLSTCVALRDVNLSYCSLISDHGIRALSDNCRKLRAVRISHCARISGVGFQGCSPTLTCLEADYCKLEPEGILGIVSGGGVEYLSVCSLRWVIHGNGLGTIGGGLAMKLRVLNLRLCRITDDGVIPAIAKGCPLLNEWNLALCNDVRIAGWEAIGLHCHNLKKLHVNYCRNLCEQGLQALRDGCRQLSILYITGCHQISDTSIEMFRILRGSVAIVREETMCIAPDWAFRL